MLLAHSSERLCLATVSPVEAQLCCLICFIFSPKALLFVFTCCFVVQFLMSFTSTWTPILDECTHALLSVSTTVQCTKCIMMATSLHDIIPSLQLLLQCSARHHSLHFFVYPSFGFGVLLLVFGTFVQSDMKSCRPEGTHKRNISFDSGLLLCHWIFS